VVHIGSYDSNVANQVLRYTRSIVSSSRANSIPNSATTFKYAAYLQRLEIRLPRAVIAGIKIVVHQEDVLRHDLLRKCQIENKLQDTIASPLRLILRAKGYRI
jgi:hypothetical protein